METVENLQISTCERAALEEALHSLEGMREPERTIMAEALERMARAGDLAGRKRQSNRRTEPFRRKLVGAQVPLELAEQVKACADSLGLSVYRFVRNCLEEACQRVQGPSPDHPPGATLRQARYPHPGGAAWCRALPGTGQENVQTGPPGGTDGPAEREGSCPVRP